MKKKVFTALVLGVILTRGIFAQQLERLTYEEFKTDGTYGRTVTVEAVFLGWLQQEIFMEGNYTVIYQCFCPYNGKWSDWELAGREPAIVPTLRQAYNLLQEQYMLHPRAGMKFYMNGLEGIKISSIPDLHASPIWWSESGRSYYMFFKLYLIKK